jgi:hypothetical protein
MELAVHFVEYSTVLGEKPPVHGLNLCHVVLALDHSVRDCAQVFPVRIHWRKSSADTMPPA